MSKMWIRCNNCRRIQYKQDIIDNLSVCPACNFHFRLSSQVRLNMLFDEGKYELYDENIKPLDPLMFEDSKKYSDRLVQYMDKTSLSDAVVNAVGTMGNVKVLISAMDFAFMGGSMGSVVGEKITRALERAYKERLPILIISCSGGARMQEGVISLMQLMKTSAAIARLEDNIAEPNALIGFAGPRVIEQTIKEKLPKGFQRSEFLLEHGMLDAVVERKDLRDYLIRSLHLFLNRSRT